MEFCHQLMGTSPSLLLSSLIFESDKKSIKFDVVVYLLSYLDGVKLRNNAKRIML